MVQNILCVAPKVPGCNAETRTYARLDLAVFSKENCSALHNRTIQGAKNKNLTPQGQSSCKHTRTSAIDVRIRLLGLALLFLSPALEAPLMSAVLT